MFQPSNTTIAVSVQFLNVGMYLFSMFLFFFLNVAFSCFFGASMF